MVFAICPSGVFTVDRVIKQTLSVKPRCSMQINHFVVTLYILLKCGYEIMCKSQFLKRCTAKDTALAMFI